jgi:hypothetical protein
MIGNRFAGALALFVAAQVFATPPAVARGVATTIEPSHGPVEITSCRAALLWATNEGRLLRVWLDFKNSGDKTATAVRFVFRASDAFGQPLQSGTGDRLGSFSPGVLIANWLSSNAGVMTGLPSNAANVTCRVEMVRFQDGSEWRGSYAPQGLYYPPTPSPTATP